jgi:hypothetical protein
MNTMCSSGQLLPPSPFPRSCALPRGSAVEGAARWAGILDYPEALFVKLAMQAELDAASIKLKTDVKAV